MKPNKRVIGLTGTIASGKSTVGKYLKERFGAAHIDADQVGHRVVETESAQLIALFGDEIASEEHPGVVDRMSFLETRSLQKNIRE